MAARRRSAGPRTSTLEKTCGGCGSLYELTKTSLPMRDQDSIDCGICGTELISWNGGCMYSEKLLKPAPKKA